MGQADSTLQEIVAQIQNPMFSQRDTIAEAFEYFFMLADTVNHADRGAMITGTMVLLNTIAAQLKKQEDAR